MSKELESLESAARFFKSLAAESKKQEPKTTVKFDKVNMLLYVEDDNYNIDDVLKSIRSDSNAISYAFILHDKDIYTEETFDKYGRLLGHEGELKQPHYHVCVHYLEPQNKSDIANSYGLKNRFIEKCKNYAGSLLYLTHRNAEDKVPYPLESIETNILPYITFLYNSYVPKTTILNYVRQYVSQTTYPSLNGFLNYIPEDMIDEVRKYWGVVRDMINEYKSHIPQTEEEYNRRRDHHKYMADYINKMCQTFGSVTVEEDGYFVQYGLTEDGKVDILGRTLVER